MTDQELLQAIGQIIEAKLEPVRQDLHEVTDSVHGLEARMDRFVPQEEFEPLEDRTKVLELTVKRHSQEIRQLQFA